MDGRRREEERLQIERISLNYRAISAQMSTN